MALPVIIDEVAGSELVSDVFGILKATRVGRVEGLATYAEDEGITAETALLKARNEILPAYMSSYPGDSGPCAMLRKSLTGLSHDQASFRLEYERPIFTTIGGTDELQIMRSSGSWESVQRVKHPASASGADFFRVGFNQGGSGGGAFIRPKLARVTQRCPIEILILGGLYTEAPESMRAGRGCVNDAEFLGKPKGYWLCEDVDINKEQLFSLRIHVRVTLASRSTEDWSTWVAPADPEGFNADPNMANVTGDYAYNVRPTSQSDRNVDGILRIGMFPTANFTTLFGAPEW